MAHQRASLAKVLLALLLGLAAASLLAKSEPALARDAKAADQEPGELRDLASLLRRRRFAPRPEVGAHEPADEYSSMRSQLPDLIAQAHRDKGLERALLKMLFDASLQSSLSQLAEQQAALGQLDAGRDVAELEQRPVNLDRMISEFAVSMVPFAGADLVQPIGARHSDQLQQQQVQRQVQLANQLQTASPYLDKREYIKPCSFNAVSCVRNPYRKHSSG